MLLPMPDVHSANPAISIWYELNSELFVIEAYIFLGKPLNFQSVAQRLGVPVLGELPLVQGVSTSSDGGWPFVLSSSNSVQEIGKGGVAWKESMMGIARSVVSALDVFNSNP